MSYKTFEIKDDKLILNNQHSAATEPSDIDVYLDSDNWDEADCFNPEGVDFYEGY